MSPKRFPSLAERLLRAGVGPRRIGRLLSEIEAHFEDIVAELQASGLSRAESEAQAEARLGADDAFVVLSAGIGFPIRGVLGSLRVAATLVTILVPFLWFMLPRLRGARAPRAPRQALD